MKLWFLEISQWGLSDGMFSSNFWFRLSPTYIIYRVNNRLSNTCYLRLPVLKDSGSEHLSYSTSRYVRGIGSIHSSPNSQSTKSSTIIAFFFIISSVTMMYKYTGVKNEEKGLGFLMAILKRPPLYLWLAVRPQNQSFKRPCHSAKEGFCWPWVRTWIEPMFLVYTEVL